MTKYAKPRKSKALRKGWRPSESPLPEGISPLDLERMAKIVRGILVDSHIPTEPELVLLNHVRVLCWRVKTFEKKDSFALNPLNEELSDSEKRLLQLGFKEREDIVPLNLWITRKVYQNPVDPDEFEDLLEGVEVKMRARK